MSAANIHTVELSAGPMTFDADLTVGQVRSMSASEGDLGKVIESLSGIVQTWPFEGDPQDPDAWDNLTMTQFGEAAEGLTEALGKVLSA